uniref:TLC domain-containing protein n=1 Tax=Craspedostauros australis TaxID=1486917 RepID=A0A7S0F6R4_9STRA|mmetsp:Transcript_9087/g.24539  ORF Transcript_9087/g.24539 Transcript_9087/m.24539 type:complete len:291 (+) Transcript_9087:180-1052(+)
MEYFTELAERVKVVHENDVFLPSEYLYEKIFCGMLIVAAGCTVVYLASFYILDNVLKVETKSAQHRSKLCYQITNLVFNTVIALSGLYLEYILVPSLDQYDSTNDIDIITGYQEVYLVSTLQLGYQLWAIPVGILYAGENATMIIHHFAVVISATTSGCLTNGFRMYSPFFYGIMEISSLPLSIMNTIKENPDTLQRQYPTANLVSRVTFGASFLFIRTYLCAYRWPRFLLLNFMTVYTKPAWDLHKIFMVVQFSLAVFLNNVQFYWAFLILKGFAKLLLPSKKTKTKKT